MRFGPLEIVIVAVVILIIFGATRLKNVGEKLGGGSSGGGSSSSAPETSRAVAKKASIRYPRLQALGILVLFAGAIVLGLSFVITNTELTWAAIGGGAIIFLGAALIIISRQR